MSKSILKLEPHRIMANHQIIEIWYEDQFIATVSGADGPGVRVFSKYSMDIVRKGLEDTVDCIEVTMDLERKLS